MGFVSNFLRMRDFAHQIVYSAIFSFFWGGTVLQIVYAFALQHHWLLPINCHFRDFKAWLDRLFTV